MEPREYDGKTFDASTCPVCANFHKGNVCTRCGIPHEGNVHFYGSKSLHFHNVSGFDGKSSRETISGNLCQTCYSDDMFELTGHRPIEPFAPHSR